MKRRYIRGFDGLRSLGVIFVILYHMFPQQVKGGYLGVVLFFVVSGYLITDLLLQEYKDNKQIDVIGFYRRRIKRLYPAMIFVILVTGLYTFLFQSNFLNHLRMVFVSSVLMFNNWWQIDKGASYFTRLMAEAPFSHFYSLAIEAQFYLVWPAVCLFLIRKVKDRWKIFRALVLFAIISALEMAVLYHSNQDPSRIYYGTDTRLFSILLGAALAFIWPSDKVIGLRPNEKGRRFISKFFIGLFSIILVFLFLLPDRSWITYRGGMLFFSFCSILLVALVVSPNFGIEKLFSNRLFDYIGKRSYGIYLWQMPVLVLMETRLGHGIFYYFFSLLLIIGLSELSFRFVEVPLRRVNYCKLFCKIKNVISKNGFSKDKVRVYAMASLVVISMAIVFLSPNSDKAQNKIVQDIKSNQKVIEAAKNKKIKTTKLIKNKVSNEDLAPYEELAKKYDVTTYQLYQASQTPILAIGDSIFTKTYNNLSEVFPNMVMDATFGIAPEDTISHIQSLVEQYPDVKTVILSIGTNQGGQGVLNESQVSQIMKILDGKKVYWTTINLPSSTYWWTNQVNKLLEDSAKKYKNLTLVPWYQLSAPHDTEWFEADGFHPNEVGAIQYSKLWVDNLFKNKTQ